MCNLVWPLERVCVSMLHATSDQFFWSIPERWRPGSLMGGKRKLLTTTIVKGLTFRALLQVLTMAFWPSTIVNCWANAKPRHKSFCLQFVLIYSCEWVRSEWSLTLSLVFWGLARVILFCLFIQQGQHFLLFFSCAVHEVTPVLREMGKGYFKRYYNISIESVEQTVVPSRNSHWCTLRWKWTARPSRVLRSHLWNTRPAPRDYAGSELFITFII